MERGRQERQVERAAMQTKAQKQEDAEIGRQVQLHRSVGR
jgi:hypothetical protein